MPSSFEKVATEVDFPGLERSILEFWQRKRAFELLRDKNHGMPKWSFLDGPITANNPMGVHHAWGRTYKDVYSRYFAMTGHELRYQNGFDCQGLWVEVEVEKELGLRSKQDIENLVPRSRFASIDRFVALCKERVNKFARIQTEQSIRLGYWMDWDRDEDWLKPPDERRSYFTMSEENNYTIWSFLKRCHDRSLIYRAYDSMPWCPRCAVGISQMEMHEGYQRVAHRAVFVRFPLRGRPGENLLVWTTTPWTLTSNVAVAVNPALTYLRIRHQNEVYYLAKGTFAAQRLEEDFRRKEWIEGVPKLKSIEQIFKEKGGYEILGELSGADMLGWPYDGPFDELEAQGYPGGFPAEIAEVAVKQKWGPAKPAREIHRVIPWDAVSEAEGTGIVHIAPGCGKEDFALGKEQSLVPIAPLDEAGIFLHGFGELEGRSALDPATIEEWILRDLRDKRLLVAVEDYPHNYPHCWRCKTELLFRLVDEWFIDMRWRDAIMKICHDARWVPDFGLQRELDWLKNMGDWMISKKRYWGLALPIWVCNSCGAFDVIGSREELKSRAVAGWDEFEGHSPHRPWVDLVKIRCAKCGGMASRISDVGNPWLDAGIVPYSTLGYNRDRKYWEKWFPADFVTESFPGQFRNWFYALLAMSAMMEERAPFKVLLGHALVRDQTGEEMHKSRGNAIPFEESAEKMGVDVMRWMFCRHNPANNINFGYGAADEIRNRFILKLWNTYAFFCNYARLDGFDPNTPGVPVRERPDIDRWILSDLQLLIQTARRGFENYDVMGFCVAAETFVAEKLSNWYVRRNRRRFWKSEKSNDKLAAYQTLYTVLTTSIRLFAPIMPFLTEVMYQNLERRDKKTDQDVSIHLCHFPEVDESLIDRELSADMEALLRLVSLGSSARNSVRIKVRQPLAEIIIQATNDSEGHAVQRFTEQISEELNIKKVSLHDPAEGPLFSYEVSPNLKTLGPKFGERVKEIRTALAVLDPNVLAAKVQAGGNIELDCAGTTVLLDANDILLKAKAPDGWIGLVDHGTQLLLDTRINKELAQEGMAREIVRHVQELRKKSGLEMEDRIALHIATDSPELLRAAEAHSSYISAETLAVELPNAPLDGDSHAISVKVDGHPLTIQLRKVIRAGL